MFLPEILVQILRIIAYQASHLPVPQEDILRLDIVVAVVPAVDVLEAFKDLYAEINYGYVQDISKYNCI